MTKKATAALAAVDDPDDDDQPVPVPENSEGGEDLNAATVTVKWEGFEFEIPKRKGRWSARAGRFFNRGQTLEGIIELIGEAAYDDVEEGRTVDDIDAFVRTFTNAIKKQCVP